MLGVTIIHIIDPLVYKDECKYHMLQAINLEWIMHEAVSMLSNIAHQQFGATALICSLYISGCFYLHILTCILIFCNEFPLAFETVGSFLSIWTTYATEVGFCLVFIVYMLCFSEQFSQCGISDTYLRLPFYVKTMGHPRHSVKNGWISALWKLFWNFHYE